MIIIMIQQMYCVCDVDVVGMAVEDATCAKLVFDRYMETKNSET